MDRRAFLQMSFKTSGALVVSFAAPSFEAIAQAAGLLMLRKPENDRQLAYFMSAENVKWRKPVQPGDVLFIEVEMMKVRGTIGKAKGVCKVRGEIVSEGEVTFMLREAAVKA